MNKVNYKQMYMALKQQEKALREQLNSETKVENVNEIPSDFNQVGWDSTIEKVESMLDGLKKLRDVKGKRLTPQFYRSIYNRALIASNEIDKLYTTLTTKDDDIDFMVESNKLISVVHELTQELAKKESKLDNKKE